MLSKERMREYQRVRRLRLKKESMGVEDQPRANKMMAPTPESSIPHPIVPHTEPILPVPVLAEPQTNENTTDRIDGSCGEARESTGLTEGVKRPSDSRGGQKPFMNDTPSPQEITHTITDIKFEGLKPGYYIFEKDIVKQKDGKDRKCWYCGCAYESRLLLNKFCCPDHKERWLIDSFRRGKE